jgi:hypothetical protein
MKISKGLIESICVVCGSKWVKHETKDWNVFTKCIELTDEAYTSGCHCKDMKEELESINEKTV